MLLYWSMFLVLTLGAVLNHEDKAGRSRVLFILFASIPSILMIGLRWRIGPDWDNYHEIYNYSRLFTWNQALFHADPGFSTLDLLLNQNNAPYWVLNLICGFVFIAGLTAFCLRQPNPWLAFLVAFPYLVIVIGMSGARQSIALGFLFFALNAFERDRTYRGAILIVAGALFHGSVILMLPICLLSYARSTVQRLVLLVVSALLYLYVFRDTFSVYAHRYSSERIQSAGLAYRLGMNGLAAVLFLIFRHRLEFDEHDSKLWRNISLCTLALIPLSLVIPSSTAIDRFLLYLFPLQFVVFSRLPNILAAHQRLSFPRMAVVGYAALVQITFLNFGTFSTFYLPYRTIFNT